MSAHTIELVQPIYSRDVHTTVCTCGWASDEHPTPGQATIAGWQHIHSTDGQNGPASTEDSNPELQETKK